MPSVEGEGGTIAACIDLSNSIFISTSCVKLPASPQPTEGLRRPYCVPGWRSDALSREAGNSFDEEGRLPAGLERLAAAGGNRAESWGGGPGRDLGASRRGCAREVVFQLQLQPQKEGQPGCAQGGAVTGCERSPGQGWRPSLGATREPTGPARGHSWGSPPPSLLC